MTTPGKPKLIQSVKRAISILQSFTPHHARWRVSELSEVLALHPSTVSRLLKTLQHTGMVSKCTTTGQYELSLRILDLAQAVLSQFDLVEIAVPWMTELVERCRESSFLVVLDGTDTVTLAQVSAPRLIGPSRYAVSRRYQAHAVSGGKVLLAHSPKSVVDQLIDRGLRAYTAHTITSPQELTAELELVRQQGYAVGAQELEIGLFAIAAPVRDHTGKVSAAVIVSGPPQRLSGDHLPEIIPALHETANRISKSLGYSEHNVR